MPSRIRGIRANYVRLVSLAAAKGLESSHAMVPYGSNLVLHKVSPSIKGRLAGGGKLNRMSNHGLHLKGQASVRSSAIEIQQEKKPKPVYTTAKVEQLRECLRNLKRNHQGEDARVRRAFQTLIVYVGNVAKNPKEEKYRKIRLSNPLFKDRIGSLNGGVEFLELCGFERTGDFLYLPHEKVDMRLLNSASFALNSAITNPFFGVLSTPSN